MFTSDDDIRYKENILQSRYLDYQKAAQNSGAEISILENPCGTFLSSFDEMVVVDEGHYYIEVCTNDLARFWNELAKIDAAK